ncbi:hypothetical protein LTR53_014548 [Teratosphaeriaceae sp. CCFEE 6253]|nr:hypothetical protein LTR53_014548 [Teratosphaeriaceae sp. CCFEE 6253]
MVLHLLGKKSWNVYNNDNVERVRRDEAEAAAREEAEEQRMQEEDAARRIAILRGEAVAPLPESAPVDRPEADASSRTRRARDADAAGEPRERKRRKLRGEDDTDADIRFARETAQSGEKAKEAFARTSADDGPLIDHAGHFQLIPAPDIKAIREAEKKAEQEAEKAKKRKREEDQVTSRFSDAAGYKQGMAKPWYASNKPASAVSDAAGKAVVELDVPERDVWGNEDPRRKDRERSRISSSDPFAAMQHAQRQLKQSTQDKERWQRARLVELQALKNTDEEVHRRRRRGDSDDGLNGFSLDAPVEARRERGDRHESRRHHHRHRSREPAGEGRRSHPSRGERE